MVKLFSVVENRSGGEMFCADIVGNVHWLGGEAAEPGSVPSAVTGLWDQVSRGVSWQPEHPAVSFAGREGACSCCLPGSNKEAPVRKGGLAGILLMSAKEAKEPLLGKNIVLARRVFILLAPHVDSRCAGQLGASLAVSHGSSCAVSLATSQEIFAWSFF